jgi:hypothetical protein
LHDRNRVEDASECSAEKRNTSEPSSKFSDRFGRSSNRPVEHPNGNPTISGQDYEHNPENKLTLTILDALSEYERAKIIERPSGRPT